MPLALWLVLGLFVMFAALFLFAVFKVSKQQDRAARHMEKMIDPFSDVEITVTGTDG